MSAIGFQKTLERNRPAWAIVMAVFLSILPPKPLFAFDFSHWDSTIKKHTRKSSWAGVSYMGFDYAGAARSREFDTLIAGLESFAPETLRGRDEALAFWINVYNIFAVKVVRDNYPVKSIKDAGGLLTSVWKIPAGKVGGKPFSLDDIEHRILRPMNEPLVHFAIVCASVSCPDIMENAYTPSELDSQLKSQTARFLENTGKGMRVDHAGKTVYLSKIFNWYENDFEAMGGVIAFLNSQSGGRRNIPTGYSIKYLPYNWDINDTR
jgi:hypothetical protein